MYEYGTKEIEDAMETILQVLNRSLIPPEEKETIREDFRRIWDDIQAFRSDVAYVSFVGEYIADEHERATDPSEDEEPREKPLCGCPSPTCALKRGELPAPARTRQGSVAQPLTAEEAVANVIQSHRDPHVLREADREWWRETSEPISELLDVKARAVSLDREYDTALP